MAGLSTMMRALVTGASGFLGTHILQRLSSETCELHAVNRSGSGGGGAVQWHAADLRDPAQAIALVSRVRPTHLLHGAWVATPKVYGHSPENRDWLQASLALAWAFGEQGGTRFVGVGTSAEYGPGDAPCIEDSTAISPATIYGKCKAACWLGVQAAAQHHGFSAGWGRVFLPYGPGDPGPRLIPSVVAALQQAQPVDTTDGGQLRDFIYAPDVADLLVRLLVSTQTGAYNVGTGQASTIRSVIEYLADSFDRRDLVRFGAITTRSDDPKVLIADPTKVRTLLEWSAPTDIHRGLDQVLFASGR